MYKLIQISLVILVLGLMQEGCKGDSPTASQPPPTGNPPGTKLSFPIGTFKATDRDGQWVQVYNADSSFTLTRNGTALFTRGRYVSSGDRVTLSENSSVCNTLGDGIYTWSFDGTSLTFVVVTDGCVSRRQTLITNTWQKQ
jgi:hypothetical protein